MVVQHWYSHDPTCSALDLLCPSAAHCACFFPSQMRDRGFSECLWFGLAGPSHWLLVFRWQQQAMGLS